MLQGTRTVLMVRHVFTASTAGFLLMGRYGNRAMMNCCHFWWTCGPYKAYAAELMADFLREHQNERGIVRERLSEYGSLEGGVVFRDCRDAMVLTPSCSRERLCKMSSNLPYMRRGELRRDQYMVSVQTGHIQSACTGEAKPNAGARCAGSALKKRSHNKKKLE